MKTQTVRRTWPWNAVDASGPFFAPEELAALVPRARDPVHIVWDTRAGRVGAAIGEEGIDPRLGDGLVRKGTLPPVYPEWLGDQAFLAAHGLRFPYVAGAMANGIHTSAMTIAMARAGMLGVFGAAGLSLSQIEAAIDEIEMALGAAGRPWAADLIHTPLEEGREAALVELYLRRRVRRVSASAFMAVTPAVVRYAFSGVGRDPVTGAVHRPNHLFAKVSRPEVAHQFMSPPPRAILDRLVAAGGLTAGEAKLAVGLPVAEDLVLEADSGGHTDNRPLAALFPTILRLRDEISAEQRYTQPIRVGAAGGIGTPSAAAAAFSLGAAFVLTGSINQAAVESGLSEDGKRMLAEAGPADVAMAPSADMFEMGVRVQVLKRGTMFPTRAAKLYELYTRYPSLEAIPGDVLEKAERDIFRRPAADVWEETRRFWEARDPREVERAAADPRHRMALVFRWYLGLSSQWAISGEPDRKLDWQIWCGPAMGAFNAWAAGSFLAEPRNRTVVQIALNILEGAAVVTRAQQLRSCGVPVPAESFHFLPTRLAAENGEPS
jgi:trans-AT polyketide synthase, acyltransferase and oxidoreductase domains